MNRRLIIFGIDGGAFEMLKPLLSSGRLPNIASIMSKGVSSKLKSVIPPITAPAWASFMTGVNPGKHGIFDFISGIHLNYREGSLLSSRNIRAKTLWEYLGREHKRLIVIGVPFTYPATKINGLMVSISVGGDIDVYPREYLKDITNITGFQKDKCKPVDTFGEVPKVEVLDEIIKRADYLVEKVEDISCYLLKTQEWDFFMAHFMSTDTIQHYFWHFIDPWHPAYDNRLVHRYKDTIYNIYKKVDKAIGNILELAGNNCNIIILSDHGFAPIYKFFYVNRWLEEKGLLRIKQGTNGLYKWKTALPSVYKILRLMGFESVGSVLPKWLRVLRIPAIKRCPAPLSEWIDWKHTVAYASPFGVNINLKGREPEGIVEKHDYEKVREIVKQELYKLRDSTNGSPVIKKVLYREEVYSGPYINDAADIFFIFKEPYYLQTNEVSKRFYFKELSKDNFATANHRYSPEGILMMCGPNIKRGELKGVNITDVTSTILYLSGLKIPQGLDGRVITEAIRPEYLSTNPVQFSEEGYEHEIDLREVMTDPKDELVKEHLRRLGYLG